MNSKTRYAKLNSQYASYNRQRLVRKARQLKKVNKIDEANELFNEARKIRNPYYGDRKQRKLKSHIKKLFKYGKAFKDDFKYRQALLKMGFPAVNKQHFLW